MSTHRKRGNVTRNSSKLQRKPQPNYKPEPKKPTPQKDNPFGLSFVVPTVMVSLPSKGDFYPKSSPMCGVSEVEIKHMTAREEDLLSSVNESNNETIFDKLIEGLLTDKQIRAKDISEEDKMAILLKARETGYGKDYKAIAYCENCQETTETTFDLSKVSFTEARKDLKYDPEDNCYEITFPVSKVEAKVRKLTQQDQESMDKEQDKKSSLNIDFNRTIASLNRVIISANGIEDPSMLSKFVEVMPAADAKYGISVLNSAMPTVSTRQDVTCEKCGTVSEKEAPISWAFFRIDV